MNKFGKNKLNLKTWKKDKTNKCNTHPLRLNWEISWIGYKLIWTTTKWSINSRWMKWGKKLKLVLINNIKRLITFLKMLILNIKTHKMVFHSIVHSPNYNKMCTPNFSLTICQERIIQIEGHKCMNNSLCPRHMEITLDPQILKNHWIIKH